MNNSNPFLVLLFAVTGTAVTIASLLYIHEHIHCFNIFGVAIGCVAR